MKPENSLRSAGGGVIQSRERMSQCQPWHRHAGGGADGAMRWHFCSPFPPTAVATSRQKAGGDTEQTDKTEWGGSRDDEKEKEWWKIANLHLCLLPITSIPLPFNRCCNISLFVTSFLTLPSISALILLPHLSTEVDRGHAPPEGSSEVCGGGLAVSNEITCAGFQTFSASKVAQKWWTGRG